MNANGKKLTRDQMCNAATLYKFHWKIDAIALHYGVHYATIRRGLQEMGLYHGRYRGISAAEVAALEEMTGAAA